MTRLARLAFVLALLLPAWARAGDVQLVTFQSETLGRPYKASVYLPDGYAASNLAYPVLYMLHGANGDEVEWMTKGKLPQTLDALISSGQIPPMIVVAPGHTYGWWIDGNKDKGETVLLKELFPLIEHSFRTIAERQGRLVGGLSAGGFGTVNLVFKHPEMFAAAAALSPAIYTPLPPVTSSARKDPPFQKDGAFDEATWTRLSWTNWFDHYKNSGFVVPLYINSGDHDRFDIAWQAAAFYQKLREIQPKQTAFRVVDGDHTWEVWSTTAPEAIRFMAAYVAPPRPVSTP